MLGYLAGLITTGGMQGAKENLKVGMIVAQEYPALTRIMIPASWKVLRRWIPA